MEEGNKRGVDLQRNVGRQLKSSLSGRSSPRNSPSFRRVSSSRTPRIGEGRSSGFNTHWFRSNRIVLWLLLITLWTYAGFYVQSRWAHGDNKEGIFGSVSSNNISDDTPQSEKVHRRDLITNEDSTQVKNGSNVNPTDFERMGVLLAKNVSVVSSPRIVPLKKKGKRSRRKSRKTTRSKQKSPVVSEATDVVLQEEEIPKTNTSYGMLVGPFGLIEDTVLEWSPEKRSGTCDRRGQFTRLVWSRKFVLIFHELSMTGAPLSMMELASELLSCGATVSAVVLNKRGGLMPELARRKIKVLEDKVQLSFKTAMKADLVIAGSAVCASWIEQYLDHSVAGSRQLVWWIMENRREYFNRSKNVLNGVRKLIFLSEAQLKQWQAWCDEENIKLKSQPALVPLSVNDELAFVAGIPCSLNTPAFSTEKMLEKRQLLRTSVRNEMGLTDSDMLVMSLSSINPGKGHFLLLESARLMIEQEPSVHDFGNEGMAEKAADYQSRALLQIWNRVGRSSNRLPLPNGSFASTPSRKSFTLHRVFKSIDDPDAVTSDQGGSMRKPLSMSDRKQERALKVLIGSVGSKSNKVPYVKTILRYLSKHSNLSKSVLWTPATTHVASLYAAADVYVINAQGLGETFGRVTIEAMAFGLPVLGTDAGGTKEIVDHNVTGLLHPLGRPGSRVLSKNVQFLLENPSARQQMGIRGRKKMEKMYLKKHMYKTLAEVLFQCMRIK